jgi:DNA-binding PadR family transcriptional regulator
VATKRKVDNLLALAVLATVAQRPMHRYEIASLIRAHGKDQQMDVKWGSLYTVVQNLAKHGFLEVVGTSRQGARPERTVYRITDAGRQELADWTRELLATPEPEHTRFAAGLSVQMVLPPDEVVELLQSRLAALEEGISARKEALAETLQSVPRLFLVEDEYALAMVEAEAAWVRGLLDELTSGTFPDLAGWRAFHEGAGLPPEMIELAERGAAPEEPDQLGQPGQPDQPDRPD